MREIRYMAACVVVACAAACTRSQPTVSTSPEPAVAPSTTPRVISQEQRSWSFSSPELTSRRYVSDEKTTIELQSDPSLKRDSFTVSTSFTVQASPSAGRPRVTGTIESVSFQPDRPQEQSDSLTTFPLSFTGRLTSGGLVLDSVAGQPLTAFTGCAPGALNRISTVQRTLMTLPATLTVGQTWTDSSTVPACSGTLPVQLTAVRTYTVAGESRTGRGPVIVIERTDRIRASGEGAQGQHRITLRAEGSGTGRMYLDPATGALLETDGKQRTELAVGASGRIERFVQVVEERTRLY
jgi:hypothetical protein